MSSITERTRVDPLSECRRSTDAEILEVGPEVMIGAAIRLGRRLETDPIVLRRIHARLRAQAMSRDAATPAVLEWLERRIDCREGRR